MSSSCTVKTGNTNSKDYFRRALSANGFCRVSAWGSIRQSCPGEKDRWKRINGTNPDYTRSMYIFNDRTQHDTTWKRWKSPQPSIKFSVWSGWLGGIRCPCRVNSTYLNDGVADIIFQSILHRWWAVFKQLSELKIVNVIILPLDMTTLNTWGFRTKWLYRFTGGFLPFAGPFD